MLRAQPPHYTGREEVEAEDESGAQPYAPPPRSSEGNLIETMRSFQGLRSILDGKICLKWAKSMRAGLQTGPKVQTARS